MLLEVPLVYVIVELSLRDGGHHSALELLLELVLEPQKVGVAPLDGCVGTLLAFRVHLAHFELVEGGLYAPTRL